MNVDETKDFALMQDNEDGTLTITLKVYNFTGIKEPTSIVLEGTLNDFFGVLLSDTDRHSAAYQEFIDRATIIPNTIE